MKKTIIDTTKIESFTLNGNVSSCAFSNSTASTSPTYSWSMGYMSNLTGDSDGAPTTNKYTITSTGNGHVEIQG